jgi:hypothetical protein
VQGGYTPAMAGECALLSAHLREAGVPDTQAQAYARSLVQEGCDTLEAISNLEYRRYAAVSVDLSGRRPSRRRSARPSNNEQPSSATHCHCARDGSSSCSSSSNNNSNSSSSSNSNPPPSRRGLMGGRRSLHLNR